MVPRFGSEQLKWERPSRWSRFGGEVRNLIMDYSLVTQL